MADPLRKPLESDFIVEPFEDRALPGNTVAVPELEPSDRYGTLVNAAETVGSTLGSAVGTIRDKVHSGLEVVKKRSAEHGANVENLTGQVRNRADQVREDASRRIQQWSSMAQRRIRIYRARTQEFSQQRPAELILTIGGAAMIVGIILRLWRSNRD